MLKLRTRLAARGDQFAKLSFAKRALLADYMKVTPRVLLVRVVEGRASRDVTVAVQPSKTSLWGWRAVGIEGAKA